MGKKKRKEVRPCVSLEQVSPPDARERLARALEVILGAAADREARSGQVDGDEASDDEE